MRTTPSLQHVGAPLIAVVLLLAAAVLAPPLAGQEPGEMDHGEHGDMTMPAAGVRAELVADLEMVEEKFTALAGALEGRWDWRPEEGVRSVSEVLGHVAAANMMMPTMVDIPAPPSFRGEDRQATMGALMALEQVRDPDEMAGHLEHSFRHVRHALARIPDERLEEPVEYFGQEGTVRSLMVALAAHAHEHLGQLIAYARMNGVAPPWSQ